MSKDAAAVYLRTLRNLKGLSQQELADQASVGKRNLQYWEAGNNAPGIENLFRLMHCLDGSMQLYAQILISQDITEHDAEELARNPPTGGDKQADEMLLRLERLRSISSSLARQFVDYGRFLEEHVK